MLMSKNRLLEGRKEAVSHDGMRPLPDSKVKAILAIDAPTTRKELHSLIGIVNYYRGMWVRQHYY
jgi:hypothetical protein